MNQGQGCKYDDQGAISQLRMGSALRRHVRPGEITYGELPRAPSESLRFSTFRIRIATARAAVVNTILINRNS
jgi:hypothetical protein